MDPTETFRQMKATYDDEERRELGLALLEWLDKGGFPPDGENVIDTRGMCIAAITGR